MPAPDCRVEQPQPQHELDASRILVACGTEVREGTAASAHRVASVAARLWVAARPCHPSAPEQQGLHKPSPEPSQGAGAGGTCSEGPEQLPDTHLAIRRGSRGSWLNTYGVDPSRAPSHPAPICPGGALEWRLRPGGQQRFHGNNRGSWHTNKPRGVSLQYKFVFIEAAVTWPRI